MSSGEGLVFGDLRAAHVQLLYRQQAAQAQERKQKKVSARGCFDSVFYFLIEKKMVDMSFQIVRRSYMSMILANPTFYVRVYVYFTYDTI